MKVVATTGNPEEGIEADPHAQPDLAVIDLRMPQLDGLRLLRGLRDAGSEVPVVILTWRLARRPRGGIADGGEGLPAPGHGPAGRHRRDHARRARRTGRRAGHDGQAGRPAREGLQRAAPGSSLDQLTVREREILRAGGAWPEQQGDRARARHQPRHRQAPRQAHPVEARLLVAESRPRCSRSRTGSAGWRGDRDGADAPPACLVHSR